MLTPEQIAALQDAAGRLTDPVSDFLIEDIARRVSEAGQLTGTAAYQAWRAQQLGVSRRTLKKELQKRLGVSRGELRQLMTQAAEVGYRFDLKRLPHGNAVPFARNGALQQIVSAAVELAQGDFSNLVQTLGFFAPDGKSYPLTEAYQKTCDFAFQQVAMGAADYHTAVRRAVRQLTDHGIQTIDYETGASASLEAAVRRNVMGGLGLLQEQIGQRNFEELGANGWEITAHAGSAPDHEPIQGKQFSDLEFRALNNSLKRRIGTLNCGHMAFPIVRGVNAPQYTDEELEAFREENERGVTYEGRHYTGYEATQVQRRLEGRIRRQKRRVAASEATGDAEQLAVDKTRLTRLNQEYARFSKAAGLRTERERTWVLKRGMSAFTEQSEDDIIIGRSVGAKATNYDVMDLETGEIFHFVEGSKIQNVQIFAGKGSKTVFRKAEKYAERFGGKAVDWQHAKGFGTLETWDGAREVEVHWVQCSGIGKFEFFIKEWLD